MLFDASELLTIHFMNDEETDQRLSDKQQRSYCEKAAIVYGEQ